MTFDTNFSAAVHGAVNGDASRIAAILRDNDRPICASDRELLAQLAERCAEFATGDGGGTVGRREIAAGNPRVIAAMNEFEQLISTGCQRSAAKSLVAQSQGVSVRTVDSYIRLTRERDQIIKNCAG